MHRIFVRAVHTGIDSMTSKSFNFLYKMFKANRKNERNQQKIIECIKLDQINKEIFIS